MKIDKVLKIEKRNNIIFYLSMIFFGIVIPLMPYLIGLKSVFIKVYIILLELLILILIVRRINIKYIKYNYRNNRLKIKTNFFSSESLIICDEVAIVHTNNIDDDIEIVIVTPVKLRNRKLRPITKTFIKKYPEAVHEYLKIKDKNPENLYYYQVIKNGGFEKYLLLNKIYMTCVKAIYTSSAIENIKIARGQNEE